MDEFQLMFAMHHGVPTIGIPLIYTETYLAMPRHARWTFYLVAAMMTAAVSIIGRGGFNPTVVD